ncbi:MAG: hypothetical protein KAT68_11745, partial [Bacteroidales bacterium]|nr:hypothetical protein [Bacteroidales bacterium]
MEIVSFIIDSVISFIKKIKRRKKNINQKKLILFDNIEFDGVPIKDIKSKERVFDAQTHIIYKFKWSNGRPKLIPIKKIGHDKVVCVKKGNSKNHLYLAGKKQQLSCINESEKHESIKITPLKNKEEKNDLKKSKEKNDLKKSKEKIYSYFNIVDDNNQVILKMDKDDILLKEIERLAVLQNRHEQLIKRVDDHEKKLHEMTKTELMKQIELEKEKAKVDMQQKDVNHKKKLEDYKHKLLEMIKKMQKEKQEQVEELEA